MNVAMQAPRDKMELPPDITSSKKRGKKQDAAGEKPLKNAVKVENKKGAKSDSESEIDLNNVPNFGADFQEILQDTLDKKLPSFFRRKTSVQRDEKRVEELVYKGENRANTNRESVVILLEEKQKERSEALETARKQLKKEGKLAKDARKDKEKDKDRTNLNLDLNIGKSKKNKEDQEEGKGTKERKRKKVKEGEEEGVRPKKEEKKGTLEKDKKKDKEKKEKLETGKNDGPEKKKKDKEKSAKKDVAPDVTNTPVYAQVNKNKDTDI